METRVNGSGVAGAEVQIDGAKNLVITVPGNEDLSGLTRSAQMNIRPVLTSPLDADPAGHPGDQLPGRVHAAGQRPTRPRDTSGR